MSGKYKVATPLTAGVKARCKGLQEVLSRLRPLTKRKLNVELKFIKVEGTEGTSQFEASTLRRVLH